jgi:hypothetical protein
MKKSLIVLAMLSAFASPASAQAFCTCDGTGNVLKFTDNPITLQNQAPARIVTRQGGLDAFAKVPEHAGTLLNSDDPGATGGGSAGYNRNLRNY